MNEKQFMKQTAAVMSDNTPLTVNISIMQAWVLISAVQLATRHPDLNKPMKEHLIATARQFEVAILDKHPEARELLNMGWHAEYDR